VFAHLYRGTTFNCAIKKIKGTGHDQSVVLKATELEDIYVEEEDKEEEDERISLKEFSKDNICVSLFFIHEHEYFFQRIKAYSISFCFSHPSLLNPSHLALRVLRI
jgi:hexokinase